MKKKLFMSLMLLTGALNIQAEDYPYLTFETADGTKTSVDVSALPVSLTFSNGTLVVGGQTFTLASLSKMYFSASNETTAIQTLDVSDLSEDAEFYDLQGRKVNRAQMRRGIYVVKTNNRTYKVNMP